METPATGSSSRSLHSQHSQHSIASCSSLVSTILRSPHGLDLKSYTPDLASACHLDHKHEVVSQIYVDHQPFSKASSQEIHSPSMYDSSCKATRRVFNTVLPSLLHGRDAKLSGRSPSLQFYAAEPIVHDNATPHLHLHLHPWCWHLALRASTLPLLFPLLHLRSCKPGSLLISHPACVDMRCGRIHPTDPRTSDPRRLGVKEALRRV